MEGRVFFSSYKSHLLPPWEPKGKDTVKETEEFLDSEKDIINSRFNKLEDLLAELKASINEKWKIIDNRLDELTKSQKVISNQYDNFRKVIDSLTTGNSGLKLENEKLKADIVDLQKKVQQCDDALNDRIA